MRVAVIINPVSGPAWRRETPAVRRATAERVLGEHGVDADVQVSEYPGHATTLTRAAVDRGATVVCSWGGDGTLNEVGNALAFGPVPVVLVPSGSGNGLARELAVPRDPGPALAAALHGQDRVIDAGEIGGRLFFNICGIGFDALVASQFARRAPRLRGFWSYLLLATRHLLTYRPHEYEIQISGSRQNHRALMIVLANCRQYGNGAIIAPCAKPDDGQLDLVVVHARSLIGTIRRVPRLFKGTLGPADAAMLPFEAMTIRGRSPLLFHVDGEPVAGDSTLHARVRPGALRVRC